jgi:putative nucleotidyltransferase with HDIG domain
MTTTAEVLGRLQRLPTFSPTAARLWQLLRDDRASAADFERVIRPDPSLCANLLRLANSAYFAPRQRVESVRQAITLLGLRRISELATSAALARVLPRRLPGYGIADVDFWRHCVGVAVMAERLAPAVGLRAPELTFTAALLHDMGKLVICDLVAQEQESILERSRHGETSFVEAEHEALGLDHAELGASVAAAWHLPEAVAAVARWHHLPNAATEGQPLVDLAHVADSMAHAFGLGADSGELSRRIAPEALARLKLSVRCLERVAGESMAEIGELSRLFETNQGDHR